MLIKPIKIEKLGWPNIDGGLLQNLSTMASASCHDSYRDSIMRLINFVKI